MNKVFIVYVERVLKYVTLFVWAFCFPSPMLAQAPLYFEYYKGKTMSMNKSTTKLYSEMLLIIMLR